MIAFLAKASPSLVFAAFAVCFWRWAPAGVGRIDRVLLRVFSVVFAVGAITFLLVTLSPIFVYVAFACGIVPLWMIVFIGLPGVQLSKTAPQGWKGDRLIESGTLLGGALLLAIILQHI